MQPSAAALSDSLRHDVTTAREGPVRGFVNWSPAIATGFNGHVSLVRARSSVHRDLFSALLRLRKLALDAASLRSPWHSIRDRSASAPVCHSKRLSTALTRNTSRLGSWRNSSRSQNFCTSKATLLIPCHDYVSKRTGRPTLPSGTRSFGRGLLSARRKSRVLPQDRLA